MMTLIHYLHVNKSGIFSYEKLEVTITQEVFNLYRIITALVVSSYYYYFP